MKRRKILLYHFGVFVLGSIGIVAYVLQRLTSPASVGGVVAMPVIAFVYVTAFGILCAISLSLWLFIGYLQRKRDASSQ